MNNAILGQFYMFYTSDYMDYLTPENIKRFRWTYAYWSR